MTWYNSNYNYRQIVAIDVFGGSGSSATIDVEIVVPSDWDTFWTNIKSNFFDVVVTDAKGQLVNYSRTGANYSNRTLTLQVDGLPINNDDSMNACYVYFGYSGETTDRSVSTTIASPKEGKILLENPYGRVVPGTSTRMGVDQPISAFTKGTAEEVDVFFMFGRMFGQRVDTYNERTDFEGISFVDIKSYDSSGTNDDGRINKSEMAFGNNYVRGRFKAGSNNTDYAATIQITTTLGQIIESRCIIRTKNLLPDS